MNLRELHEYTGKLLAAGQSENLPITVLVDGDMREVRDIEVLEGYYEADASPKLIPSIGREGRMVGLCSVQDDFSDVLNYQVDGCRVIDVDVPK